VTLWRAFEAIAKETVMVGSEDRIGSKGAIDCTYKEGKPGETGGGLVPKYPSVSCQTWPRSAQVPFRRLRSPVKVVVMTRRFPVPGSAPRLYRSSHDPGDRWRICPVLRIPGLLPCLAQRACGRVADVQHGAQCPGERSRRCPFIPGALSAGNYRGESGLAPEVCRVDESSLSVD
jgi:hypothetical protein